MTEVGEKRIEKGEYVIAIAIILATLLICATIYIGANNIKETISKLNLSVSVPAVEAGASSQTEEAQRKEVTLEFLYADWCGYCQKMKPIVQSLESSLPSDRFEVIYLNEKDKQNNTDVAAAYSKYTANGYFKGFPTFVINGNDYKVGAMPEETFKQWVCSKFSAPKPSGC